MPLMEFLKTFSITISCNNSGNILPFEDSKKGKTKTFTQSAFHSLLGISVIHFKSQ